MKDMVVFSKKSLKTPDKSDFFNTLYVNMNK